jgi:hypothetical protein
MISIAYRIINVNTDWRPLSLSAARTAVTIDNGAKCECSSCRRLAEGAVLDLVASGQDTAIPRRIGSSVFDSTKQGPQIVALSMVLQAPIVP